MSTPAPANPICAGVIAAMDDGTTKIIKKAMRLPADGITDGTSECGGTKPYTYPRSILLRGTTVPIEHIRMAYSPPERAFYLDKQMINGKQLKAISAFIKKDGSGSTGGLTINFDKSANLRL